MRKHLALFAAAVTVFAAGCGGSGDFGGGSDPRLRFVNAGTGVGGNVDIEIGGSGFEENVVYGGFTGYERFDNGNRNIEVRQTGTTTNIFQSDPDPLFEENNDYTLVGIRQGGNYNVLLFEDDNDAIFNQGRLRIIHASPSATTVDVYVVPEGTDITPITPTYANVTVGTGSLYQALNPGDYDVIVTAAGSKTPVLTENITFTGGQTRTMVVVDNAGGTAAGDIIVLTDTD